MQIIKQIKKPSIKILNIEDGTSQELLKPIEFLVQKIQKENQVIEEIFAKIKSFT